MAMFEDTDTRQDPKWVRASSGKFHRLALIETDEAGINGVAGVYVIWHGGVRPRWVYVGRTKDLGRAIDEHSENEDIMVHEVHGGLFVSWSLIREEFQDGVVRYLIDFLKPIIANPSPPGKKVQPVAVFAPGDEPK